MRWRWLSHTCTTLRCFLAEAACNIVFKEAFSNNCLVSLVTSDLLALSFAFLAEQDFSHLSINLPFIFNAEAFCGTAIPAEAFCVSLLEDSDPLWIVCRYAEALYTDVYALYIQ